VDAGQPLAARMDADDLFVLGPYRHHRAEVGLLERLVERGFGVVGTGESHFCFCIEMGGGTRASTCSGVSLRMQSKWPSGHSRRKQGEQGISSLITCACSESGGVKRGVLEPYSA